MPMIRHTTRDAVKALLTAAGADVANATERKADLGVTPAEAEQLREFALGVVDIVDAVEAENSPLREEASTVFAKAKELHRSVMADAS